MAAAIKAVNAKIRSNKVLDYVCSTHFWGPVSNFGIPIAAVMDTQKDPEIMGGRQNWPSGQVAAAKDKVESKAEGVVDAVKDKATELQKKLS